jgi:uncharacterized phiE125 gp8 family phage protein
MSRSTTVTAAAHEPLLLDELKDHLAIERDDTAEDLRLWSIIRAARARCETFTGRYLIERTVDESFDAFPGGSDSLVLSGGRLQSVTSITYTDSGDTSTVVATTVYEANAAPEPGRVALKYAQSWPAVTLKTINGVVVRHLSGLGTADEIPDSIKAGLLLECADAYRNAQGEEFSIGGSRVEMSRTSFNLWWPYRIVRA